MRAMTKLLFIAVLLVTPATASDPIKIFVDGEQIGTHQLLEYRLSEGEIHITTNEGVYGCKQDVIYRDRFQALVSDPL